MGVGKENKENGHIVCESGLLGTCHNRRIVYNVYNQKSEDSLAFFFSFQSFPSGLNRMGLNCSTALLAPSHVLTVGSASSRSREETKPNIRTGCFPVKQLCVLCFIT